MASTQQLKFVIWAPDRADGDRLSVRPKHLERAHELMKDGTISVGGAVLTPESANAAPADRKIFGSCSIFEAESLEAARKLFESDIYYTSDVWDKEKLQILPILLETPLPAVTKS